jgi:hypothetical protein
MTGDDLHVGVTGTHAVSRRSGSGQGILGAKENIGKYGMLYNVVCESVLSSCMSVDCSLTELRDI